MNQIRTLMQMIAMTKKICQSRNVRGGPQSRRKNLFARCSIQDRKQFSTAQPLPILSNHHLLLIFLRPLSSLLVHLRNGPYKTMNCSRKWFNSIRKTGHSFLLLLHQRVSFIPAWRGALHGSVSKDTSACWTQYRQSFQRISSI